jgi:predicted Zn-dependent protease with MMP-like domain
LTTRGRYSDPVPGKSGRHGDAGERREIASLLDRSADCLAHSDPEGALDCADRVLALSSNSIDALHYRAAALVDLDRHGEAAAAFEAALRVAPDDLDVLADAAEYYESCGEDLERGIAPFERAVQLASRGSRLAADASDEEAYTRFVITEARALLALGQPREALRRVDAALARSNHGELQLERGVLLYETCRFPEAREQLLQIAGNGPGFARANHVLGLIAERLGESAEAAARLSLARREAPEEFPAAVELSAADFDVAVENALASLPEPIRRYLANVAIAVEDLPADEDLLASDPPLSPSVLGMFRGAPLAEKASMDPWSHFPSSIVLYQRNLQRFAQDPADLVEQIGITLVHEVGHFLGFDEQELWDRGLG